MTTPILWSWVLSPFAGKVRVAAMEMEVELDLIEIHPVKRPPKLKELNPTNRVPVLEVGDVAIRESSAICEYLQEAYPDAKRLWPADVAERGRARGLMRWVDDELTVNFFLSTRKEAFGIDERNDHPDVIANLRGALARRWRVLEGLLAVSDGPWLIGGEEPTLADLSATPLAVRLPQWKPELAPSPDEYPLSTAFLAALRERPSAAAVEQEGVAAE